MKKLLCIAALMPLLAQADVLRSPDGKISAETTPSSINIRYGETNVISVPKLGIAVNNSTPTPLQIESVSDPMTIAVDYDMLTGKKKHYTNRCNKYTLTCKDQKGNPVLMEARIFDDGVAFRYILDNLSDDVVTSELTTYHIPEGTNRWMMMYTQPYEEFFPYSTTGEGEVRHFGYPSLIEPVDGVFALISEADIRRYHSASSLSNEAESTEYVVTWPENTVSHTGTWVSPWRMVIVGDLPTVVNSSLVTDLSPETTMTDTEWIAPGGVSWVYWAYNHGSNDYQIVKKYIDMAATLGLPYVLIDAEWDEMTNGGDINDAVAYALSKGVKPLIWYNSSTAWIKEWGAPGPHNKLNKPADREAEFAKIADMGVAGVKIDFFDGDKQETMDYCIDLLESAAKHHLLVNFHGATIPRGWQRTYPNLMSVEAVYGAEWYNNLPVLTDRAAAHNATLPFTRNVIGPMDYTPTTFSDSQYPHITTHCHELALPVVFESALLHWADRPESYLAQPQEVQQFIGTLPTVWDETCLLAGYPGRDVAMARRSGNTWYVGVLNGLDETQTLDLDWSQMHIEGTPQVRTFADGNPWIITDGSALPQSVTLQPRGGAVFVIRK